MIRDYFGVKEEERTRQGIVALKKSVLVMDVTQGWIVINENRKLIADIITMRQMLAERAGERGEGGGGGGYRKNMTVRCGR